AISFFSNNVRRFKSTISRRSRQVGAARHAFRADPHLYLKLRPSIAVAAPIEQVIDPDLHHLDVAVALGESVAGEEWGASRDGKCPIVQPQIAILDLGRPVGGKSPLDARAPQPTAVGVVVGDGDR